jgi:type III secretory pathway lipoprotein EscJ
MSEEFIDDDVEVLFLSELNDIEARVIISMLESYGIPVLKKSSGSGGIMEIYFGANNFGIDLYVPSKMLKQSLELINSEPVEYDDDIEE